MAYMESRKSLDEFIKSDEDDFSFLLWRIMRLWQRDRQKFLDEFNTTISQLEILGGIYYLVNVEKKETTQILLSQETGIDPMTTSTILRNLEKKGLVIRKPSQKDTRARIVEVTKAGYDLLLAAMHRLKKTQEDTLQCINQDVVKVELLKLLKELENRNN